MGMVSFGLGLLISVPLALVSHAYSYHDLVGVSRVPVQVTRTTPSPAIDLSPTMHNV